MRHFGRTVLGAILMLVLLAPTWARGAGEGWTSDFAAAQKQAAKEKKDLLLDFTGSDWCIWCQKLNEEVFSQAAFKTHAAANLVLVELDFPQDQSKLSEALKQQNAELQQRFNVQGFPTILLMDATGRPYAQTGYQEGGAEGYVAHLTELRGIREKRDAALAQAKKAKGVERAKHLDVALAALGEPLAMSAYGDVIREIIALDAKNTGGLKKKYERQLAYAEMDKALVDIQSQFRPEAADTSLKALEVAIAKYAPEGRRLRQVLTLQIGLMNAAGKNEQAIAIADKALSDATLERDERVQFAMTKISLLQQAGKQEEALALAEQLWGDTTLEPAERAQFASAKVGILQQSGKTDEALSFADLLWNDASLDTIQRVQFGLNKAGLLQQAGRIDEALIAFDEIAAVAPAEDDVKAKVLIFKGHMLSQNNRNADADKAFDAAAAATENAQIKDYIKQAKAALKAVDNQAPVPGATPSP